MAKTAKIDDVKHPDKVAPSATARPIVTANQPALMNDPMMAPASAGMGEKDVLQPLAHMAKALQPLGSNQPTSADAEKVEPKTVEAATPGPATVELAAEPKAEPDTEPTRDVEKVRDPDAALTAEETTVAEAKLKREQEVEGIIASDAYALPINALQRRRSRINTMLLALLAVLLAVALLDVIADVGIVHVPSGVPHTHFFSDK